MLFEKDIKSKIETLIIEKENLPPRWDTFIWDLFQDNRREKQTIPKNMEQTCSVKIEIKSEIAKMNRNKKAGSDRIVIETYRF